MRITVFGAGSVGGFLAWHMARAGLDVAVVARGAHLDAIRRDGLTLETQGTSAGTLPITATDDPHSLGVQDVIFVTLKQPSVAASIGGLKALSNPDTRFVFVVNGIPWWMEHELGFLDPGGQLAGFIPQSQRIGSVARISTHIDIPGRVSMDTASARFILGPAGHEASDSAQEIVSLLTSAGIEAAFTDDLRPAVWDKLFLNIGFGLLAAILGLPVGQVASQAEAQRLLGGLLEEIRLLAKRRGVTMTMPDSIVTDPGIQNSPHQPSLLQDLNKHRHAEIDALITAPLLLARREGISTPVLDSLAALIITKARVLGSYSGNGILHDGK